MMVGLGVVRIFLKTSLSQFGKLLFYEQAKKEKKILQCIKLEDDEYFLSNYSSCSYLFT